MDRQDMNCVCGREGAKVMHIDRYGTCYGGEALIKELNKYPFRCYSGQSHLAKLSRCGFDIMPSTLFVFL